jgi:hypothetical protein
MATLHQIVVDCRHPAALARFCVTDERERS